MKWLVARNWGLGNTILHADDTVSGITLLFPRQGNQDICDNFFRDKVSQVTQDSQVSQVPRMCQYTLALLHANDRPIGPLPLRGRIKRGGAFSSPEGRLFGFRATKRDKNSLTLIKHRYLYRLVFIKPYNRPNGRGKCTPSLILPRWGRCPTDLSLVCKIITLHW